MWRDHSLFRVEGYRVTYVIQARTPNLPIEQTNVVMTVMTVDVKPLCRVL
jgi:hypothetical protein